MADLYREIAPRLQSAIQALHIFFLASAAQDRRVNVSSKRMDSLREPGRNRMLWHHVSGRKIETYRADKNQTTLDGAPSRILSPK